MTTVSFARNSDPIMDDFATWPFRYILILWLYAIANIPFDLARFDKAGSDLIAATALEDIGKCYLHKSGVESESSALLLSRLYTRLSTVTEGCLLPILISSVEMTHPRVYQVSCSGRKTHSFPGMIVWCAELVLSFRISGDDPL